MNKREEMEWIATQCELGLEYSHPEGSFVGSSSVVCAGWTSVQGFFVWVEEEGDEIGRIEVVDSTKYLMSIIM